MTAVSTTLPATEAGEIRPTVDVDHVWRRVVRSPRVIFGGGFLVLILLLSLCTLPLTIKPGRRYYFDDQNPELSRHPPSASAISESFGTDSLGRGILSRCLLGGATSLTIGIAAAALSVFLGVAVGL